MLKRLYVNNYKALVNFELEFNNINLFLGENGSGKSSVFEVLDLLRNFITDDTLRTRDLFQADYCTKWMDSPSQRFELALDHLGETYRYELEVEHDKTKRRPQVKLERLRLNEQLLMNFEEGLLQIYDNGAERSQYPFDPAKSALASLVVRPNNPSISNFRDKMANLLVVKPLGTHMESVKHAEDIEIPDYHLENFVSWYRYLENDGAFRRKLEDYLQDIFPDFEAFSWDKIGRDEFALQVNFKQEDNHKSIAFEFWELSDGQRNLIALYTILHLAYHRDNTPPMFMICIDEPENFVGLREIQPWLQAIQEQTEEENLQIILISHHPEVINYLLFPSDELIGYWFERDSNLSHVRVKPISTRELHLPASELMASGWFNGE